MLVCVWNGMGLSFVLGLIEGKGKWLVEGTPVGKSIEYVFRECCRIDHHSGRTRSDNIHSVKDVNLGFMQIDKCIGKISCRGSILVYEKHI